MAIVKIIINSTYAHEMLVTVLFVGYMNCEL